MTEIAPTPFQSRVLGIPLAFNVFLGGGRGGGKSYCMLLDVLRHVEQYKDRARPLIIRETYKAASELAETLHGLLVTAYGRRGVRYNKADNVFRLGNGAIIEIGQLDGPTAYTKYQGRSFTYLGIDEIGLIRDLRWVQLLRSNLRAPDGIPLREVRTANPGGIAHAALVKGHRILQVPPWMPYQTDDGETWVNAPSTLFDNSHLAQDAYVRRIKAAVAGDVEMERAWINGDWAISRGAMLGDVWDPAVHVLPVDFRPPHSLRGHRYALGMDWGSSAPCCVLLGYISPGDDGLFPPGSLVVLDERNTADPADISRGLNWPPSKVAEEARSMCAFWNAKATGVGDDAVGLDDTLLQVLQREGVWLTRPVKGPGSRIAGVQRIRQRLLNAVNRSGPGLYVSGRAKLTLETVPTLPRDPNRPEDVATDQNDHAWDALRYLEGYLSAPPRVRSGRVFGMTS